MQQKKRKIGMLVEPGDMIGGIQSAIQRHMRLLSEDFEFVAISFENSKDEKDWYGRREKVPAKISSYAVFAADFKCDNQWSETASIESIRHDLRYRSFADQLIEIIKEEKIELLHSFGQFQQRGMIASYASAKTGIPYMLSFRGVDLETRIFEKSLSSTHVALISSSAIICVCEDSAKLVRSMFQPKCPVFVVNNHVDPNHFQDKKVEIAELKPNIPVIGCFGKFRRVMGLDFLLKAFDELCESTPAQLLMVGKIQKREADFYLARISEMKFKKNLIRLNYVPHDEVVGYMRRCDALVYPSITDASPNKVLEAMLAKVPFISTTAGGIPEIVRADIDGILVPPRTVGPIVDGLKNIFSNKAESQKRVESAYTRVTTDFHIKHERPKWMKVYEHCLHP